MQNLPKWELENPNSKEHNTSHIGKIDMRLVGKEKLQRLLRNDHHARTWLQAWIAELASASWKQPSDVCNQFPNARQSDSCHFIFPISNCNQEVCLQIAFPQGIAVIIGLQ